MAEKINPPNPLVQSPYTYLQTTGSDGSDGTASGFHLRWDLLRNLGDQHLPKGELATKEPYFTDEGFNKENDYVHIYRAAFEKEFPIKLELETEPDELEENGDFREWIYRGFNPVPFDPSIERNVKLRFLDLDAYDTLRTSIDPSEDPLSFLDQYPAVIELFAIGHLKFKAVFELEEGTGDYEDPHFKVESVSEVHNKFDRPDEERYFVSTRDRMRTDEPKDNDRPQKVSATFHASQQGQAKQAKNRPNKGPLGDRTILCENIDRFRFRTDGAYPTKVLLSTYEDHIQGVNGNDQQPGGWEFVGDFALDDGENDNNAEVFKRLEDPSNYVIDQRWPKYNEADPNTGAFTVKVANYEDRWTSPNGLKQGVIQYLIQSVNDPKAKVSLPSDLSGDQAVVKASYLNLLNIVALDFHVARMLGLGHIDDPSKGGGEPATPTNANASPQASTAKPGTGGRNPKGFVYLMVYQTPFHPENEEEESGTQVTHLYMSLPTTQGDYRLPPEPVLKPVSYGLEIDNKAGTGDSFTDAQGYAPFSDQRVVNLHREPFLFEFKLRSFFDEETPFEICQETPAVQLGVEYKGDWETEFRRPEINNDPNYFDHAGIPVTTALPRSDDDPFFTHKETEEGIHDYGAYSINWFSRPSPVSDLVSTDETEFPERITLLPPSNFSVQLIQEEDPLIFTTSAEQNMLSALTTSDKTLVRVTFDWDQVHAQAYQFADRAEFFFREEPPQNVRGKVDSVTEVSPGKIQVTTKSYTITSKSPAETVQPEIPTGEEYRYEGGRLQVEGEIFLVESIDSSGTDPTLTVEKIQEPQVSDPDNSNQFCYTDNFISPKEDAMFLLVEELDSGNWDSRLVRSAYLESFHTVHEVEVRGSSEVRNNKSYVVREVVLSGSDTELRIEEDIPVSDPNTLGDLVYLKKGTVVGLDPANNIFKVDGDISGEVSSGDTIDIRASKESDGTYSVNSVNYDSGNDLTEVEVSSSFGDTEPNFYLRYEIVHPIQSIDAQNKAFVLSGDLTNELEPPYREIVTQADGSQKEVIRGGLTDTATIEDIEALDDTGNPIPNSKSGAYKVIFDNLQLQDHIDPDIEWYQGGLRVKEDASQLPPPDEDPSTPNATVPERKKLEVRRIDQSQSTLELVVYDPDFDTSGDPNYDPVGTYVPIETGNGVHVNFHPSYRLYLKKDTEGGNNFEEPVILPNQGEGKKETFMGVRSFDSTKSGLESAITPPTILLALEIVEPAPPGEPTGPTFATRPDFYGKSTYTFDIEVDTSGGREPHAIIFYRGNERAVLDQLYKPSTVQQILTDLENLASPDADFFVDRWNDLVNVNVDPSNDRFKEYVTGGYRFPNPDNDAYVIPVQDPQVNIQPFDGSVEPGNTSTTFSLPDGRTLTMKEVVKLAIEGAFVPLTEQPVVYAYIDQGTQTSEKEPTIRDANGDLLDPNSTEFDPFPMVRKFNDGSDKVRFTDYKLDGAARNFYFYFAVELSNKLKVSDRSPVSGPIQLVNSLPADPPGIKKIDTRLAVPDLGGGEAQPPGVNFRLNEHPEGEHIKGFRIYRSTSKARAQTVRTMDLAKEVSKDEELVDDFEGLPVPLFGEPLFYRIVALREIENEFGETEKVPSEPSELFLTNIIDNLNPPPPDLAFSSDPLVAGPPPEFPNVVLRWNKTVHNGRYHIYKMKASGNWTKIHTLSSNDALVELDLASTGLGTSSLAKKNEADEIIYHRFRVDAENASGLLNLTKNDLVI